MGIVLTEKAASEVKRIIADQAINLQILKELLGKD